MNLLVVMILDFNVTFKKKRSHQTLTGDERESVNSIKHNLKTEFETKLTTLPAYPCTSQML